MESVVVLPPDLALVRETLAGRGDVAAVMVEAGGASSGAVPLPAGFNAELAQICRAAGSLFVMDEVVTGFRWAPGGVQEVEGVRPDLTTLAKILAGGLPGGAVAGRRDLLENLAFPAPGTTATREKIGHPGTFNANPVSAAAGVAALSLAEDGSAQRTAAERAHELRSGMNRTLRDLNLAGVVYGTSSVFRIVLGGSSPPAADDPDSRSLPSDVVGRGMAAEVQRLLNLALLDRGVHFFGNGGMTSVVHTKADVAQTVEAWRDALLELRDEGAF